MNIKKICAALAAAVISVTAVTVTAFAASAVTINSKNFPDKNFREYVSKNFDIDKNGKLSQKERDAVTGIYVSAMGTVRGNITSLKGIEKFKNLEELSCFYNKLEELDVTKNTELTKLNCNGNYLTKLDVSKNTKLYNLRCYGNKIKKLDVSKCDDIWITCDKNVKVTGCKSDRITYKG